MTIGFSNGQRWYRVASRTGAYLLLIGILLLAFWIRMLGRDNIPTGQFNGTDTYLYYWQAEIVAEDGRLPPRDMHRWLPLGRDLGQTLNLYSYAVAYAYK